MLDKIIESCRFLLQNYPDAQDSKSYLDSRLSEKTQEAFQFGYFPPINSISVLTDLVGENSLYKEKLFSTWYINDSTPSWIFSAIENNRAKILSSDCILINYFEDHPLIMPFRDAYGKIAGLVGRTLLSSADMKKNDIPKYKNSKESQSFKKGHLLFGLYENKKFILELDSVYIVEGQFDVIKAYEIGFRNIVALGNNNMTPYQFSLITRYTNNIFLLLDNDEAGQKGRKRIIKKYGHLANIRNFYLPDDYKDIDECIVKTPISSFEEISFVVKD